MKYLLLLILAISSNVCEAQAPNKILLINGFLHKGNGETIKGALIGIENGKIEIIKNTLAYTYDSSDWDTIIDLKSQHIYPGFIAPNSTLGITEIDAVRATRDYREVGIFNPHVRSQIAFNVESKVISTVRTNGVLISQATPRGGIISGSSSVMKLDGWNWEDATISANDGIHLNWPESIMNHRWSSDPIKASDKYVKEKAEIYSFFEMSKAYANGTKKYAIDNRMEAMKAIFNGEKRVYIHANELQQLMDIVDFTKYFKLDFPVIVGGYDAHLMTRQLVDAKIPVMLVRPHSLPENEEDDVNHCYKLPSLLQKGGVKFCIQNHGDMEAMNARNIPFLAGTAQSYGLTEEDAISAISLWSAEIMGIEENYGSIEKGKSATLFISKGNALDMRTNNISLALIDGHFMTIANTQEKLYKRYSEKYKQQKRD